MFISHKFWYHQIQIRPNLTLTSDLAASVLLHSISACWGICSTRFSAAAAGRTVRESGAWRAGTLQENTVSKSWMFRYETYETMRNHGIYGYPFFGHTHLLPLEKTRCSPRTRMQSRRTLCETNYLNSLHFSPATLPVHCRLWNAKRVGCKVRSVECKVSSLECKCKVSSIECRAQWKV